MQKNGPPVFSVTKNDIHLSYLAHCGSVAKGFILYQQKNEHRQSNTINIWLLLRNNTRRKISDLGAASCSDENQ